MIQDKDQVIKGLCMISAGYAGFPQAQDIIDSAVELLREQDSVRPMVESDRYDESWYYVCGECRKPIDYKDNFCCHCGRKVKWDV